MSADRTTNDTLNQHKHTLKHQTNALYLEEDTESFTQTVTRV